MSMMVSFVLSFFPRDVLDEILKLIESVSEDFPSYSFKSWWSQLLLRNIVKVLFPGSIFIMSTHLDYHTYSQNRRSSANF